MNALETRKLTKEYGSTRAVDALDLVVPKGALFGFLGPNGAGKTTTIRMALGLIRPTGGEVVVLDQPVFSGGRHALAPLRRIGAIVEEPAFWGGISARRNLELFARAAGPADDRTKRLGRVEECLKLVDLEGAASKKVKAFSHGMRQRLGIARAMLGEPELLVLDEPTNGLDPQGIKEVRELMRRLVSDGITVFLSSHLLGEVETVCDEVAVLGRGRLLAQGPPAELAGRSDRLLVVVDDPGRARAALTSIAGLSIEGEGEGVEGKIEGVEGKSRADQTELTVSGLDSKTTAADVNELLVSAGVRVSTLVAGKSTLEDTFLHLTEGADVPR